MIREKTLVAVRKLVGGKETRLIQKSELDRIKSLQVEL
jgi:hypothetical protein